MSLTAAYKWSEQRLTRGLTSGQWTATKGWSVVGPVGELANDDLCTSAPGIPVTGDAHDVNSAMTVQTVTAQPGLTERAVLVNYQIPNDSLTVLKPVYEPVPYTVNLPIDTDRMNNPIVNTAGLPFPARLNGDETCLQMNVTIQAPYFDTAAAIALTDQTNSAPYTFKTGGTIDTGQGIIKTVRPTQAFQVGVPAVPVLYAILCRKEGWKRKTLNESYSGWGNDGMSSTPVLGPFCNSKGTVLGEPTKLDARGLPMLPNIFVLVGSGTSIPIAAPDGVYYPDASMITTYANATYINFDTDTGEVDFNSALPF